MDRQQTVTCSAKGRGERGAGTRPTHCRGKDCIIARSACPSNENKCVYSFILFILPFLALFGVFFLIFLCFFVFFFVFSRGLYIFHLLLPIIALFFHQKCMFCLVSSTF